MEHTIHHFRCDFELGNGAYMLIDRTEAIPTHELITHQVQMLRLHSIPGLLAMEIEETDGKAKFRYDISGKRMLSQHLKVNHLSLPLFYEWVYQLIHVLDESKLYMLSMQNYLLEPDFIFVDENGKDLYFTYLPLKDIPDKEPYFVELSQFVSALLVHVQELQGRGVQQLLGWVQQKEINLHELQQRIQSLILKVDSNPNENQMDVKNLETPVKTMEEVLLSTSTGFISKGTQIHMTKKLPEQVPIAPVLIVLTIWLGFALHPMEQLLYLCTGLTIMVISFSYVFLKKINRLEKSIFGFMSKKHFERVEQTEDRKDVPLLLQTSMLRVSDATVWLGNEPCTVSDNIVSEAKYMLQIHKNNQLEQVSIEGDRFLIGRSETDADYTEDDVGLSRIHCEIVVQDAECYVKDLGSMNGSSLNGERMAPYKMYAFHSGDVLKIMQTEFVLSTS